MREPVDILLDKISKLVHRSSSLGPGEFLPRAIEGCSGSSNGNINVFRSSGMDISGDDSLIPRVYQCQSFLALGSNKFAIDVQFGLKVS